MSAVVVTSIETPAYFEVPSAGQDNNQAIQELVHELRQPLSSIEAIAYYVEMTLPPELLQARQHMRRLQELVSQAESVLENTTTAIRKPPASAATGGAGAS
ncbi:MAG TPA: hypothetical protein VKX49_26030 [Bryobacteraceae bacterium]|nr:hypothetical protein [Bryobacteraceae bacterium]